MDTLNLIHVGIADMGISTGEGTLRTILGSCVGICLYDQYIKMGGLAHIMLPSVGAAGVADVTAVALPEKYADTALPLLVKRMQEGGADIRRMKAKIAGGSKMFGLFDDSDSAVASIGMNNVAKVEQLLSEMGIELLAKDVGGSCSRIISFNLLTGEVKIKAVGISEVTI